MEGTATAHPRRNRTLARTGRSSHGSPVGPILPPPQLNFDGFSSHSPLRLFTRSHILMNYIIFCRFRIIFPLPHTFNKSSWNKIRTPSRNVSCKPRYKKRIIFVCVFLCFLLKPFIIFNPSLLCVNLIYSIALLIGRAKTLHKRLELIQHHDPLWLKHDFQSLDDPLEFCPAGPRNQ